MHDMSLLCCGCQVINVRSLKPLDRDTIVDSVRKTHRVIALEEGWPQSGFCSEIIAVVNEECFDDLDAPPERITGAEVSTAYIMSIHKSCVCFQPCDANSMYDVVLVPACCKTAYLHGYFGCSF